MARFVSYRGDGATSWGVLRDGGIVDGPAMLTRAGAGSIPTLLSLVSAAGDVRRRASELLASGMGEVSVDEVRLLAPLTPPRDVFAVGANYATHVEEAKRALAVSDTPAVPIWFSKAMTSVCGPNDAIEWWPALTSQLDYELELAVVIGRGGRNIPREEALAHVFGYMVLNDVSARDVQHGRPGGQWFLGKSMDTFCPTGPWLVTADEIPDPHELQMTLRVNGEVRQDSTTDLMIFDVPELVADLSRYVTLLPGDLIATGTPGGVGAAMNPPRFLADGDEVEAEIHGIGLLRNRVIRRE